MNFYRIAIILYTLISIVGLSIFALAENIRDFDLAIVGRAVFGIGASG